MSSRLAGAASRWAAPGPGVPETPSRQHDTPEMLTCARCWCDVPADMGSANDGEFICEDCADDEHGCPDCRRSKKWCVCP